MGLDVKAMQVSIRGFLELSVTSFCSFVKKCPVVSSILLFLFILYMFLPSVFTFLVFSVPVLFFIFMALRLIFSFHQQNLEKARGEKRNLEISAQKPTCAQDDLVENNREDSSTQAQSVRRRNAKEKEKRVSMREGVEKEDMGFSAISNDALVDKAALLEENLKDIREVNVDSVIDRAESSSAALRRSSHECGDASERRTSKSDYGGSELDAESSDDGEDEDEEEEAQEDGNKAVEWTEDDQKNLMDLGISEMERNKRLESLIARRKARKLLSMQARRTLMNMGSTGPCDQIASVLIPRPNPFLSNVSSESQVSPTPGSAPSVLLPMHNPFDLPYDPQEEKPNLTGGSFQEEFIAVSQKDLMFCRHESFSLGASFPGPREFDQNRHGTFYCPDFATRPRAPEIPEYSRFRNQSGKEDPKTKLTQTESSLECKPMLHFYSSRDDAIQQVQASERVCNWVDIHDEEDRIEVHNESNLVRDDVTGGSSSSSSSELNVPFSAAKKEEILKSLSFSVPKNTSVDIGYNSRRNDLLCDNASSSFRNKTPEERFFFPDKVMSHTPTHSIASDMQVEVSEVSSTISRSDGGSPSYEADLDMGKEANSGSEEMWVASSQLSKVEEIESRSREVHEVSEQDIIEVGFLRMNQKTDDIIASNMLPEIVVEEDSIDAIVSFPNIKLPERSHNHLIDFDGKVHDEVQLPGTSYASDALSTENLASLIHENALQLCKESAALPSQENNPGEPEELSDCPEISSREVNVIYDTNDEAVFANGDTEIMEFIKNTYGEAPTSIKGEATKGPSALTMENDAKTLEITQGSSGFPQHDNLDPAEIFEGEFREQGVPISNFNGNENIQNRRGEQVVIDVGSSGSNPSSNDTITSARQPEIVTEQGPSDSSSSSSLTSLTQEKFPNNEVSLLNFGQTQIKVQEIASEVMEDNFADFTLPESSNLIVSQNALHLKETSVTCLSNDRDPGKPQGEHLTILKSKLFKPAEESVHMNSSEDFESQPEHKDRASPSRPIEKMDIWDSTQGRECDQNALDIRYSGVSQIAVDPSPSVMLPKLVVEQIPIASSSSSSPNSDVQKMVSVEQVSSSSIDPKMHLEVQKSNEETVEIHLLDKLLPENLDPPALQDAQHTSSNSTANPSCVGDHEEPQEPSSVKVQEVIANKDMRNLQTIDDINSEAHTLPKEENTGVLTNTAEESISKSIDVSFIEGHTAFEGENVKVAECENTVETSNPVANNSTLETSQESGQEIVEVEIPEVSPSNGLIIPVMMIGTAESGLSQINQSFSRNSNSPDMLPEVAVGQVPLASSSSSSPNSVLQSKFSIGLGSVLSLESLDQEIHVEARQSETEMEESALINGLQPENLVAPLPQNSVYATEDSRAHLSDNRYFGDLQEQFDSLGKSTKEEREEPSKDDQVKRFFVEADIISNENELVFNLMAAEEDLGSSVGETEGDPLRMMRSEDVSEHPKNPVVNDSRTTEYGGGESDKLMEAEAVVGLPQPAVKKDNLNDTKDTEESRILVDHEKAIGLPKSDQSNSSLDHLEDTNGEIKEVSKDNVQVKYGNDRKREAENS